MLRVTADELADINTDLQVDLLPHFSSYLSPQSSFLEREGQPIKDFRSVFELLRDYTDNSALLFSDPGIDMR